MNENNVNKIDTKGLQNEIISEYSLNDETIIPICIKNILECTLEGNNAESVQFLKHKNEELNNFIEKNIREVISPEEKYGDKYRSEDDMEFTILSRNSTGGNNKDVNNYCENILNNNREIHNLETSANEHIKVPNTFGTCGVNEKKRNKTKRRYIDVDQMNFDFEKEDFACSSNDEFVRRKYADVGEYANEYTNECENKHLIINNINLKSEAIRSLLEPPPIPFNHFFQKYNKEISDVYIKHKKKKNSEDTLNIFLESQLLCIEEDTFKKENSFINNNFDNFITKKLNVVNSTNEDKIYKNKDLQELLKYLMSWYFSGFYSGKMCKLKELHGE
ncbi:hypothetical protein, conserved [Plasmodium gonderi]|uniref:Uncharacterized protein n=1 Tax=Plasmodium gonderi TaxID=77519 RepID=A0A1Y1JLG6_PLAGO|nr:hypothetical protein, conserved [Plasmodium gonderi]GAW81652.1 hypothetical protein, conserved [Plasmodium gonderi]